MTDFEKIKTTPDISAVPAIKEKRELERQALYERIDQKVEMIRDVRIFVKNSSSLGFDDFREECLKKMETIKAFFDQSVIDKFSELIKLGETRKSLEKQLELRKEEIAKEIYDLSDEEFEKRYQEIHGDSPEDFFDRDWFVEMTCDEDKKYKSIDEALNKADNQIFSLLKNDDVDFIKKFNDFFADIISKRGLVIKAEGRYKADPVKFLRNFENIRTDKIEVLFSGINVNIIIPPEDFLKIFPDKICDGFHRSASIYNFIKDRDGKEGTINHEENHNLAESFVPSPLVDFLRQFNIRLDRLNKLVEAKAPKCILDATIDLLEMTITRYTNDYFNEIVADIDRIPDREIKTFLAKFLNSYEDIVDLLDEIGDDEIRRRIFKNLEVTEKPFIEYIDKLSIIFLAINKFGNEEDREKIKGAIILFGPNNLYKVEKYARHILGEEVYDALLAFRPLLGDESYFKELSRFSRSLDSEGYSAKDRFEQIIWGTVLDNTPNKRLNRSMVRKKIPASFFNPNNLKKLNELLETLDGAEEKDDQLKTLSQLIERSFIESIDFLKIFKDNPSLFNLDTALEMEKYLKNIGNKLGIPEFGELIKKKVLPAFKSKKK